MKTATLLAMTALTTIFFVAGNIRTPVQAAVKMKSIQVKPKVTIRVRPQIRVRINTKRQVAKKTNAHSASPGKTTQEKLGSGSPSRIVGISPDTGRDVAGYPLPREKPSRFAALDNGRLDRLRELDDATQIFNTLRELEIIKNIGLFGQEDGSTAGVYDEFTTGLADNLPDGVNPTEPTVKTEAAPEHVGLFTSGIPQPGARNNPTPPDDGGAERHPGGNRPGQGQNRSGNTKIDLTGRNGPASDGDVRRESHLASDPDTIIVETSVTEDSPPGGSTRQTTYSTGDGQLVTYVSYRDENGREFDRSAEVETSDGEYDVTTYYDYDAETRQYVATSMRFSEPGPGSQPVPHDGASHTEDVSGLCGTLIPSYICARGVNSTASPEEMTTQPAKSDSGGITVTRLGQGVVTDTGDGSFQTPSGATPHSEAAEDDGSIHPGPLPDCITCTPNR